jgi:hypothetical protein
MVRVPPIFLVFIDNVYPRTSATNAARIYNNCLSKYDSHYPSHMDSIGRESENTPKIEIPSLQPEHVWDVFTILSLLEGHESRALLSVPHGGSQNVRFDNAVSARNLFMSQSGQPEWAHYCSKCCRVWEGENGEPSSASLASLNLK